MLKEHVDVLQQAFFLLLVNNCMEISFLLLMGPIFVQKTFDFQRSLNLLYPAQVFLNYLRTFNLRSHPNWCVRVSDLRWSKSWLKINMGNRDAL
jgi:hypothetical protein